MNNFANASFSPEFISVMQTASDFAVTNLPEPVSSGSVQSVAETILLGANEGVNDPVVLQRLALSELQLASR